MRRNIKNLLQWETERQKKVIKAVTKKRLAEKVQVDALQNSGSFISEGSKTYLENIGRSTSREKVEDSLIKWGDNSKKKKECAAAIEKFTYSPIINGSKTKEIHNNRMSQISMPIRLEENAEFVINNSKQIRLINAMIGNDDDTKPISQPTRRCKAKADENMLYPRVAQRQLSPTAPKEFVNYLARSIKEQTGKVLVSNHNNS